MRARIIRCVWSAEFVLACAVTLLNRGPASMPPVELVDVRPAFVSPEADAYVLDGAARIYLVTTTSTFTRARGAAYQCGNLDAIRKIASVLVHEEWHVRHGTDEAPAYHAQLTALAALGAGPGTPVFTEVQRSMRAALGKSR